MTARYEILLPDGSMVLSAIDNSTAKKFVDDLETTLLSLDQEKIQEQIEYLMRDCQKDPPK